MLRHHLVVVIGYFLASVFVTAPALAQLAPSGSHYAGRPTDTGYGGSVVDASGRFPVRISLDLPAARGGIPVPLQIAYGSRGVGAAGLGWDIPLSFVRRSNTLAHYRPRSGAEQIPALTQHVTLSLFGDNAELVRQGSDWIARSGSLALNLREDAGNWSAYDENGRTYLFTAVPGLAGEGLFLLKSISGAGGAKAELTYQIVSWPIDGGTGYAIDLINIAYDFRPTQLPGTGCAKHEIALSYQHGSIKPVALSVLDDKVLVRKNTLSQIDVDARTDCASSLQRLRRYQFQYIPDPDTGLPLLSSVRMSGRQGTPEELTTVPVGSYSYGSATDNGALRYRTTQTINLPVGVALDRVSGTERDSSFSAPEAGSGYSMGQTLTDMTGDGRVDLVFRKNDKLWMAKGLAGPSGSTTFGVGAQALVQLSDNTFTSGAVSTQSSVSARFQYAPANRNTTDVWRQAIDINGDGRIDIIDAAEEADHWVVYLNTPDPVAGVKWQRRSFSVKHLRALLISSGHTINGDHVPLSRRATGTDLNVWQCWRWENHQWNWYPQGFSNHRCQGTEGEVLHRGPERTFVEWELADLNGDGYPDFVFDSDPVDFQVVPPSATPTPVDGTTRDGAVWQAFAPKRTNEIRGAFNVLGVRFDTDADPFSRAINLSAEAADQGIEQWVCPGGNSLGATCDESVQAQVTGLEDVNGDGLLDRIVGTRAYLGTYAGTAHVFSPAYITLPGPLAKQVSTHDQQCKVGGAQTPTANQTQGLRDLTGDGIPDYFDNGRVWIGTGTGFNDPVPILTTGADFRFSHQTETCNGDKSNTDGGLYDIDGDGKPDVVGLGGSTLIVSQLEAGGVVGAPGAGRLVAIDNGFGATTSIRYVSAKQFADNALPFPEIVVSAVSTTGMLGLGGDLAGFTYAYGRGELAYDSVQDRFAFPGYGRQVAFQMLDVAQAPSGGRGRAGIATITDRRRLAPFTPGLNRQQRWLRDRVVGRVSDVFTLRAAFNVDPWSLLGVTGNDTRLLGGSHYDYDAKLYELPVDPADGIVNCLDIVAPLDFQATLASLSSEALNACTAHGFVFQTLNFHWHGDAPPSVSDQNVQTRSQILSVDDFGRPLLTHFENDIFRVDDDFCVEDTYAPSAAPVPHVLTALKSRRVFACGKVETTATLASGTWTYDNRSDGAVADGRITSQSIDRHATDSGALLNTIHVFDASYDANGNLSMVRTQRDGATRTTTITYDPFGLVPTRSTTDATGVPSTVASVDYDPLTLQPTAFTDPNNAIEGIEYDGFGRYVRTTVTPSGGAPGVMSTASYLGYGGGDPAGMRMALTQFSDPILPANLPTATGRSGIVHFDELGRQRWTEIALGSDYRNETIIASARTYDGAGRLAFEADPYPASETTPDHYGSTYLFGSSGDLQCQVRGSGRQIQTTTDPASERFPTCYQHMYGGHRDTFDVRDAASLEAGSPQEGVVRRQVSTAIGLVVERSALKAGARLDHSTYAHDRLGQLLSLSRYLDPTAPGNAVTWSLQWDSLGQLLQLAAPETATRNFQYSDWGEGVETSWVDGPVTRRVSSTFDALGRMVRNEENNNGITDPSTVNLFSYDSAVSTSPLVSPTFVLGRLANATSSSGQVTFSYDALGQGNANVFTDNQGGVYVQKATHHADGQLASIEFDLPDRNFDQEVAKYGYDSAGRLRTVKYVDASGGRDLFTAEAVDPLGRLRAALYGGVVRYEASYAPGGRRLIQRSALASPSGSRLTLFERFDPLGRELSRREIVNGAADGPKTNVLYDALGRLVSATKSIGATTLFDWKFGYDALGNVTRMADATSTTNTVLTYRTLDRDRLCRVSYDGNILPFPLPRCNVIHDAMGNIVAEPTRNGTRELAYFSSGGIRTITDAAKHASFAYDAFGGVQTLDFQNGANQRLLESHFGEMIERRDMTQGTVNMSVITRNIPGLGGMLASRRGSGNDWVFSFGEQRGNRFFANQDGTFVQDTSYQPYGKAQSTGAAADTPDYTSYQWNGGNFLAGFGLSHLGERLYDPEIGRFLSRDTLLVPRTSSETNPYAFAMNDPINLSDPTGLDGGDCIGKECHPDLPILPLGQLVDALGALFGGGPASPPPPPPINPALAKAMHDEAMYQAEQARICGRDPDSHFCDTRTPDASPLLGAVLSPFTGPVGVPSYYIKTEVSRAGMQSATNGVQYFAARDQYNAARANIALSRVNEEVARYLGAAIELSGGMLHLGASGMGKFNCFAEGTPVATAGGEVPIETLKIGDRVSAGTAQCTTEHLAPDTLAIRLEMPDPQNPSHPFHIELARSQAWLDERSLGNGEVELSLEEAGSVSRARVIRVSPAPSEQPGEGCLVLMTVEHSASELLRLTMDTGTAIVVTPLHSLFVEGQGWVPARDLNPGVQLRGDFGPVRLVDVEQAPPGASVFNLEVGLEHTYRVAPERIWAHNGSPAFLSPNRLVSTERTAVADTLAHIDNGTVPSGPTSTKWGVRFLNRDTDLPGPSYVGSPQQSPYREFRVAPSAGSSGAGTNRIVVNIQTGEVYYTWTHYGDTGLPAFVQIR